MLNKIITFFNTYIENLINKKDKQISPAKTKEEEKEQVGNKTIEMHRQDLSKTKLLASIIKNLDMGFFASSDFVFYLNIKSELINNQDEYQDLNNPAELFSLAVKAKDNFLKIEQTELRYRSLKQQEFYDYIFDLLRQNFEIQEEKKYYSPDEFKSNIRKKLEEVSQEITREQGRIPLQEYCASLEELAIEKNLGLKLLYLFKTFGNVDFSVLRIISDMVVYLQDKNIQNLQAMEDLVMKNQGLFLEVGRIVGVPQTRENATTYSILLQYLVLNIKYESFLEKFSRMSSLLKDWFICYKTVTELRERYPENEYAIPEEFKQEIKGLDIYEKYSKYIDLF